MIKKTRTKCQVFTRVMGYHRPIESFNLGKKGEHMERIKFDESKSGKSCVLLKERLQNDR